MSPSTEIHATITLLVKCRRRLKTNSSPQDHELHENLAPGLRSSVSVALKYDLTSYYAAGSGLYLPCLYSML
ncbi:hypothetical protein BT96DRAFT_995106 [Gymnopus androsaceus JB14]|uniref:Uncharacterized protein n=1 Tax=Gymnopus androsaceus JB14 TaxID=1447944 RepID=A0A6A4HN07_9AGAR|nr:hypothetical protein BT96DRAFT_995106 [Gymnopus androsaceus JB14]